MKGELEGCFTKFLNAAALWFHEGYRIEMPIGSFYPKVKLMGEHTCFSQFQAYFLSHTILFLEKKCYYALFSQKLFVSLRHTYQLNLKI